MNGPRVAVFERLEMMFVPKPWRFADEHSAEIGSSFAEMQRAKPELWNGRVLLLYEHEIAGRLFRGRFLETDYASFKVWRAWGMPEAGVCDCFALGALRAADGAFLLGVMGPHTANAGEIYCPAGTPDPIDLVGAAVDFERSVRRELAEETGLTPADYAAEPGWRTVIDGPTIAHFKVLNARQDAATLRACILDFLARDPLPELCDIRIVRGPADLDPMIPDFVAVFLRSMWGAAPDR
jgi:8-oxo-dGTP pyrophosphatase MutT (NUDIX family)